MAHTDRVRFDSIGYWSEIKLDIVGEYASAYSTILSARRDPSFHHIYIDAFAGAGMHVSRATEEFTLGSPVNALFVNPPFKEYYLIDIDGKKVAILKSLVQMNTPTVSEVHVYEGDCNSILLEEVLPHVLWNDYRRAFCLLDPAGLHLD